MAHTGSGTAFASRYGLVLAFLATIVTFSVLRPSTFPTLRGAESILTAAALPLIIAVGMTVVLVMQDFDLSLGGMIGLASGLMTALTVMTGWSWELALAATLAIGVAVGVANGFMVAALKGSSFIITLAMGTVLTGIEYALTHQATVYEGFPPSFAQVGRGQLLGLSNKIWIAMVVTVLVWALLDRTETGRYMYAIGGNAEAARLSGIRVGRLRILGFVIVGLASTAVGVLIVSQSSSYAPNGGVAYLLPAFAAVFLGSAVFRPGEFNVMGTVVGVLFLGVIQTGLTLLNLETFAINLVQGAILIVAVLISKLEARTR